MDFDWTTFALEVLNFLVLVWLLKRFFYRPVLAAIEARRAENAKIIAGCADPARRSARLKERVRRRVWPRWTGKPRRHRLKLDGEIAAARTKRLAALEAELAASASGARPWKPAAQRAGAPPGAASGTLAARFAARLLERLAGPELEAKLVDLALNELDHPAIGQAGNPARGVAGTGRTRPGGHRLSARRGAAKPPSRGHSASSRAARRRLFQPKIPFSRRASA